MVTNALSVNLQLEIHFCKSSICKECSKEIQGVPEDDLTITVQCPRCKDETTTFTDVYSKSYILYLLFNLQHPVQDPVQVHNRGKKF